MRRYHKMAGEIRDGIELGVGMIKDMGFAG